MLVSISTLPPSMSSDRQFMLVHLFESFSRYLSTDVYVVAIGVNSLIG